MKSHRSNDLMGYSCENAHNYTATRGILALDPSVVSDIFIAVQNFKDFDKDNDPYGEHDFGLVEIVGNKVFLEDRLLR